MEEIRDAVWQTLCNRQNKNRESLLNRNRNLEYTENTTKATKKDVIAIANDLKKKNVKSDLLSRLKEILLENKENIVSFLHVDGALEALVKALSGQSAKLQINAAYCLCNLSLGDNHLKIIRTAGPYLILHLEGMNIYLIEACAWTLGNLSSHDKKGVKLLKTQGVVSVFARLLTHSDENVRIASSYALTHLVYTGYDVLTEKDFQEILQPVTALYKTNHSSVAYLMSVLSSNPHCQLKLLQEGIHVESLNFLKSSFNENILNAVWYIRIISNLITEESGKAALHILSCEVDGVKTVSSAVEHISRSGQTFLIKECCWLLGNLINHGNEDVQAIINASDIINKIADTARFFFLKRN